MGVLLVPLSEIQPHAVLIRSRADVALDRYRPRRRVERQEPDLLDGRAELEVLKHGLVFRRHCLLKSPCSPASSRAASEISIRRKDPRHCVCIVVVPGGGVVSNERAACGGASEFSWPLSAQNRTSLGFPLVDAPACILFSGVAVQQPIRPKPIAAISPIRFGRPHGTLGRHLPDVD